jgi:hypothetical protein
MSELGSYDDWHCRECGEEFAEASNEWYDGDTDMKELLGYPYGYETCRCGKRISS